MKIDIKFINDGLISVNGIEVYRDISGNWIAREELTGKERKALTRFLNQRRVAESERMEITKKIEELKEKIRLVQSRPISTAKNGKVPAEILLLNYLRKKINELEKKLNEI